MKKIVFSLAGVLAATAFAPEASALPAFARQVGMACTACHFQHFPVLNSFGRAFRAAGYTMMGAQGKVEGEHLSLPENLNAGLLLKARYQKGNATDAPGTISGTTINRGQWQLPDELVILFGGRVGENVGAMVEIAPMGALNPGLAVVGGMKVPFIFDVGPVKVGVTPYLTDTQGSFYGYDLSSSGQVRASRWSEDRNATSAQNYTGLGAGAATGLAFSVSNEMGYVAVSKFARAHGATAGTDAVAFDSTAIRAAVMPTIAGWATHIGVGVLRGTSFVPTAGAAPTNAQQRQTKGMTFDAQAQGELGGMETSFYLNYAKADASKAGEVANTFNAAVTDKKALVVAADFSVIPHVLAVAAGYRAANVGLTAAQQAAGLGDKDNAIFVQAIYDLYQNVALHAVHSKNSGSAYTATGVRGVAANSATTTLMLEMAW